MSDVRMLMVERNRNHIKPKVMVRIISLHEIICCFEIEHFFTRTDAFFGHAVKRLASAFNFYKNEGAILFSDQINFCPSETVIRF